MKNGWTYKILQWELKILRIIPNSKIDDFWRRILFFQIEKKEIY